jgi:tRNA modification GTPase
MNDTIFALSTAPGRSGVAVLRVSGRAAAAALLALAGSVPRPREAKLATLRQPYTGEVLDRGLVLFFPAPHSFTGEDVAEFQVHGGRAVVAGIMDVLSGMKGLRPAEPGEFVRRAFEAGKMDLAQTEALADLLEAETAAQRRLALNGLEGGLGQLADGWRGQLIQVQALIEAYIDFPDEGDIPSGVLDQGKALAEELRERINAVLSEPDGNRLREGATVVVAGPPNAGKSSFMNRVAKRDIAIVTPFAGTTRDMLELHLDLGGLPVTLIDTAGVREATDPVEVEAVRRAVDRSRSADLVLWFSETVESDSVPDQLSGERTWLVRTKADQPSPSAAQPTPHVISAHSGHGIPALLQAVQDALAESLSGRESALITRVRHRTALEECVATLHRAQRLDDPELIAEELRLAARALGRISGRVDVEDILDVAFGSFCIGK